MGGIIAITFPPPLAAVDQAWSIPGLPGDIHVHRTLEPVAFWSTVVGYENHFQVTR